MSFPETDIKLLVKEHYQLAARAKALTGEYEFNYLLTADDGTRYIFKIATEEHSYDFFDAQVKIVQHLSQSEIADKFYRYIPNKDGELITGGTEDQVPTDSVKVSPGWLRRPTDRLITVGLFFQDYLSTNKNFKVHLNTLYGSNMPYNIPNSVKYRNGLIIEPYFRVDIGFSVLLLDTEKYNRRSHHPFRNLENIWASLEIFNLLDRRNTISYLLIKDFSNNVFAIPNRLTPRLLNFKILVRF